MDRDTRIKGASRLIRYRHRRAQKQIVPGRCVRDVLEKAKTTHHGSVRLEETCVEEGVVVVDVNPHRNRLVVDGAQVWMDQLREWSRARCLNLQYLQLMWKQAAARMTRIS